MSETIDFPKKSHAFHDPYMVNKGRMFSFVVFIIVSSLIGITVVSFAFELDAALKVMQMNLALLVLMVGLFNVMKIVLPLFTPIYKVHNKKKGNALLWVMRGMTICFSAFMSVILLTAWLRSPNLESIRNEELVALKRGYEIDLDEAEANKQTATDIVTAKYTPLLEVFNESAEEKKIRLDRIKSLNAQIDIQTLNVVGGQVEGPIMRSLKKQLDAIMKPQIYPEEQNLLFEKEKELNGVQTAFAKAKKDIEAHYKENTALIQKNTFDNDHRTKNQALLGLEKSLKQSGVGISYNTIMWSIGLLVTGLIEIISIVLAYLLGCIYGGTISRHIQRKEHLDEAALQQTMAASAMQAQEHSLKSKARKQMNDIINEFQETSDTYRS